MAELHHVHGEPSWKLATNQVEAYLTRRGGHLGPISFSLGERTLQPYHVAPWAEEPDRDEFPPILAVLRGDFFCLPFGGNDKPFGDERHPPHGETANGEWKLVDIHEDDGAVMLHAGFRTSVRPGEVDKYVTLIEGHHTVYSRHVVRMEGPMSFGHHAMLRFPDEPGLVAVSPFVVGRVAPDPLERPEDRGYSFLQPDATFSTLAGVPTITGDLVDLSRYPTLRGYENLVLLVTDPAVSPAWTAVTFPGQRFVWFALKDPKVLRQTIFWMSNGGRHYPPWNGRHVNVMGLEEVTSYFHYGLARSAAPNPLSDAGYPTHEVLSSEKPLDVRYANAVAEVPAGFDRVASIEPIAGEDSVVLRSESGLSVSVAVRHSFVLG